MRDLLVLALASQRLGKHQRAKEVRARAEAALKKESPWTWERAAEEVLAEEVRELVR